MTLPANFGRAVDLSALRKPAATPTSAISGKEVTASNLATEFVALSRTKLVVILCWSARSQESLSVLEILSKLQKEAGDRWELGTVNIDVEAQVAQALQVRTVPYAVALVAEQVVPLFEQNYPEPQIRAVIEKVLSISDEQGIGTADLDAMEPEEEEALTALGVGDLVTAEAAYKKLIARKPAQTEAIIGLAQTQLLMRTDSLDAAEISRAADAAPENVDLAIQSADCEMAAGNVAGAFARLVQGVRILTGEDRDRVKSHLLELFTLVDATDPRLVKARSALANALF